MDYKQPMSRAVLRPPRTSGDELQLFMKFGTSLTPGQPKPSRPQGHWFQGCPEKHQNTGLRNPPNSSKPDRLKYIYPNFTGILKFAQVLKLAPNINIYIFSCTNGQPHEKQQLGQPRAYVSSDAPDQQLDVASWTDRHQNEA